MNLAHRVARAALAAFAFVFALCGLCDVADAQSTLLQGGTWQPGHIPQYVGQGSSQPVVIDGGGAGGGAPGVTLSELGITDRDPNNSYPSQNSGTGPYGSHFCLYDAPTNNPSGYHVLCLDPNAQGGGLISYGVGGIASQLPLQCDINGVLSNCLGGGGGNTITNLVTPTSGFPNGAQLISENNLVTYTLGTPVVAAVPNTIEGYFAITWTGSGTATIAAYGGQGIPPFAVGDVGKDIVCTGIGSLENDAYAGVISGVSGGTTVTLIPPPALTMTAVSQRCAYGADQTINLQNAFTTGQTNGVGSYVPGGIYLVNTPLTCLPPVGYNNLGAAPPLCELAQGAVLIYSGTGFATNFVTFGSLNSNFTGYVRNGLVQGGTINGNFNVLNCVYAPFFLDLTHTAQVTKNCIHGLQYGDVAAPQASGGVNELASYHTRDINYVAVASATAGANPVITTQWDHGFTAGRVVFFTGVAGSSNLGLTPYQITVTGARSFTLNNFTLTGTVTAANVSENFPSMSIEQVVTNVTNTNPAVLTVAPGAVANGEAVFVADIGMSNAAGTGNCIDGVFASATLITSTTFSIPVDATGCGSFAADGFVIAAPNWTGSTNDNPPVDAWIYNANSTDMQYWGGEAYGVRAGVVNNPATSGYDGKIQFHVYDYFENGELLTGYFGGGDNNFHGLQVDCPARFAAWLVGPRNTMVGSEMNCSGFSQLPNNEASFVRLDTFGFVGVLGGSIKGQSGASIRQEVSSPYAQTAQFGNIGGYNRIGLSTYYTTYTQPETMGQSGNLQVIAASGAGEILARGSTGTLVGACDGNPADTGGYIAGATGGYVLASLNDACNFVSTSAFVSSSLWEFELPVQFGNAASFTANGSVATTLTSLGPTGSHTTVQEWLTVKDAAGTTRYIPAY
jgi:hypothetical protein